MQRTIQLESKPFAAGGNVGVSLKGLPSKTRVRKITLRLEALITTGAAQATAVPGSELFRLFSNIEAIANGSTLFKATGQYLHTLAWVMRGAEDYLPASVPNVNSSAYRRTISLVIPFWDMHAWSPADFCPNAESFNDTTLNVDFAALASMTGGSLLASVSGTLRVIVTVDDTNGQVGSLPRYGYQDFASQSVVLDPGLYTHVWAYKEDGTAFTSAEVSAVSARVDGTPLITTARAEELAFLHDYDHPTGGAFRALSATAPVAAEQLTDEPAVTAGAASTVSPELLILFAQDRGSKLTQAMAVQQSAQFDFQGSLQSFRIGFRRADARNEAMAIAALNSVGVPIQSAGGIVAKTESKAPLSSAKSVFTRWFPLRGK